MAGELLSSTLLATFGLPTKGTWQTVPIQQIPADALYSASNVVIRAGNLQRRPGMSLFNSKDFAEPISGIFPYVKADGTFVPVVAGTQHLWKYASSTFTDITGANFNGDADHPVSLTELVIGSTAYVLRTNGNDAMRYWDGVAGTDTAVSGSPPVFTDICTAFDRIVGIKPPFQIQWGNALSISTWSALNFRNLADTPDQVVAVKPYGATGILVFKQRSVWPGFAQGGSNAQAFAFPGPITHVDGPAGTKAIVTDGQGIYYWITPQGRIAMFDGTQVNWIADGIWGLIQADMDPQYMNRTVAMYSVANHEIMFFYPQNGTSGAQLGAAVVNLPRPDFGIPQAAAFPWTMATKVTGGSTIRLPTTNQDVDLVFSQEGAVVKSYTLSTGATTDGAASTWNGFWQTGMIPAHKMIPHRLDAIEPFLQRSGGYGSITLKPVTSFIMDSASGTLGSGVSVSLTSTPTDTMTGMGSSRGRFFGLRVEFTSADNPKYTGAFMTGWPLEMRRALG